VKNLSNVLVEVMEWDQLGINLDLKPFKLKEIGKNKPGDIAGCRLALIDLWLRSDINASWQKLTEALEKLGEYSSTIDRIKTDFLRGSGQARGSARGMVIHLERLSTVGVASYI
jgi:hypothetical protein